MGTPNYARLASMGQLPPDKQSQYDMLEKQNAALKEENEKLKLQVGELTNIVKELDIPKLKKKNKNIIE